MFCLPTILLSLGAERIEYLAVLVRCTLVETGTKRHFFAAVKLVRFWGGADISLVSWIGASVVNDPLRTSAVRFCCDAQGAVVHQGCGKFFFSTAALRCWPKKPRPIETPCMVASQ